MHISHENIDEVNAVITVNITPEDYNPKVDQAIKDQAKKANLAGFRPGMVPVSHIRRTYGKSILFDEVNGLVNEQIGQYIESNKLEVLGQPLPKEDDRSDYNWDFKDEFSFNYEIGLTPTFESPFTVDSTFTEYSIKADKKTLEERMKNLRRSYGKMTNPDVSEEGDVLYAQLDQVDSKGDIVEGGVSNTASVRTDVIEDKGVKKSLVGLKVNDEVTIDFKQAFKPADAARILGITEEAVAELGEPTFKLLVKNVNRLEEADLNAEFFDKVFGEGVVTNEAEFKEKVREEVESMFVQSANQRLQNDLYTFGMDTLKVDLPEAFLKRWIVATNPDVKEDELEEGFADFLKNLQWTIIENRIIRENNLEVQYEEVLALAEERIAAQLQMYGQGEPTEDELKQYAIQLLQDREQANRLFDEVKALKVFNYLKDFVKIEKKDIDYDKFLELE